MAQKSPLEWTELWEPEIKLSIAKYDAYLGVRDLSIEDINSDEDGSMLGKPLDHNKVELLCRSFASHGCQSHDHPILVLKMQGRYFCSDGKHRLAAARAFFGPEEQFWPAHVFATGDQYLSNWLMSGQVLLPFSDGDLYRIIRYHESVMDHTAADSWRAKLCETSARGLQFLDKAMVSDDRTLAHCFNRLLPFVGLWQSFVLGTRQLESLRCHEEVGHYIDRMYTTWSLLCENCGFLATITTVQRLENKFPTLSSEDAESINNMCSRGEIFEEIPGLRPRYAERCLQSSDRLITMASLFEDIELLAVTAGVMRLLVPKNPRQTLRRALFRHYRGPVGEFGNAYHRLWVYVWREFPDIYTGTQFRLRGTTQYQPVASAEKLAHLVTLAKRLHFTLGSVSGVADNHLEESVAHLLKSTLQAQCCAPEVYTAAIQKIQSILMECLEAAQPDMQNIPVFTSNDSRLEDAERSGIPFAHSFMHNRTMINWETISSPRWIYVTQQHVSTFAILHDQFRCFFDIESTSMRSIFEEAYLRQRSIELAADRGDDSGDDL